ncbi:orotidine-5'-phosphate decarboxylase [Candidatus Woesearchaeota archaeon]|nr:orotidine-5'-phosphate decarboxylase [Candidatus Woesearchaeota archaeon]
MRIDPHVHFRDEDQSHKGTIANGLKVAAAQGVDIVFDMPNTARPVIRRQDVLRRLALVPESERGRYFLWIGATSDADQLREAVQLVREMQEVVGIKMYAGRSTGDLAIIDEEAQQNVYSVLAESGYTGVLAVHCEKESCMTDDFDPSDPTTHARARPSLAEVDSVMDQINFARRAGFRGVLHICHVSVPEAVELINDVRKELRQGSDAGEGCSGFRITCGVTPHHLLWDENRLRGLHGVLYKMNPPLRSAGEVAELRRCLLDGKIDWIETDHAPHAVGEKLHAGHPSGYPTLYIYKDFVEQVLPRLGLTEKQISALTYRNIAKTFGISRMQRHAVDISVTAEMRASAPYYSDEGYDSCFAQSRPEDAVQEDRAAVRLTDKEQEARMKVCLPLDGLKTLEEVEQRVKELSPVVGLFKIGKESFTRFGPEVVRTVKDRGAEVFLDLKYHDIPNTVRGAARAATQMGVYMFNVHASGGVEMMKAAREGAQEATSQYGLRMPKVIGVTILTSIDQQMLNNELRVYDSVASQVLHLARLAQTAGLDGVVCSAADLYAIKDKLPRGFMFVTPGIKGPNTPAGEDQKRVFTPGNAVSDGSSILVIGRAITGPATSEERVQAGLDVLRDMAERM